MFGGLAPPVLWLTVGSPVTIADSLFDQRFLNVSLEMHREETDEAGCGW